MSLINTNQFKATGSPKKLNTGEVAKKVGAQTPRTGTGGEETKVPGESYVPSQQKVEKAETQVTPQTETTPTSQPEKPLRKPREGSEMAQMLENIEHSQQAGGKVQMGSNGTLAVFEEPITQDFIADRAERVMREATHKAEDDSKTHQSGHGHGHGHKEDALMGGHLGTEVVEKVGHKAHHAVEHAVSHAADAKAHAVTEGTTHAVGHAKSESVSAVGEFVQDATQVAQSGQQNVTSTAADSLHHAAGHGASEVHEAGHEVAKEGVKHAAELSTGLSTALIAGAGASGGLGAYMLVHGGKEAISGFREGDYEKGVEGVGSTAVGLRSLAAGTVMADMVSSAGWVADAASVASKTLTPLGIAHGAIDIGLGVKEMTKKDGDKVDGALKVAFGTSIIAGAAIGGIPLTAAALTLLAVKTGRKLYKGHQAKKAAQQQEAQTEKPKPEPLPDPAVFSDPYAALKDGKT